MHVITSFAADEHYTSPAFEAGKQFATGQRRLVNFYAFNKSAATIYLKLSDGDAVAEITSVWYPVPAGSFISIATPGGDRYEQGIKANGYTTAGGSTPCGNELWFKCDWTAYL